MTDYSFNCPLPNGMHARPASALEEVARCFNSSISLVNERTGRAANAKSVLAIVGIEVRHEDRCRLAASGDDEQAAIESLSRFVEQQLPHCDDALPAIDVASGKVNLPPMLADAGVTPYTGTAAVPGIGQGTVVAIEAFSLPGAVCLADGADAGKEVALLESALASLVIRYDREISLAGSGVKAQVLAAHRSIARDPEFRERLEAAVRDERLTAAGAIAGAERRFTGMLRASGSALLRERALDVRDVCLQLMRQVYGDAARLNEVRLSGPSVCAADSLTPERFLALDRHALAGLVLTHAGATSHTVILARSFGVPTLVGVDGLDAAAIAGQEAVVDGELGVLVTGLSDRARRYYEMERRRIEGRNERLHRFAVRPAETSDGRRVEVAANIGSAREASAAVAAGAEAIGLFRTEMLFMDREQAPSVEEQFEEYARAVESAGGRTVTIRTLDIGGDKPLPYLKLPVEANPFLGCRAVRLYPEFERLFRDQVQALVRASATGPLWAMIPMIASVEEARWVKRVVAEEQEACRRERVAFDPRMPLGAMIEVPSAALLVDILCRDLDFFSIGTNDLLQYFTAVDRANPRVAGLYDPQNPAFLRLLKGVVDGAHRGGRPIGLCGEMGGEERLLPLVAGLGLDEISMAAPAIARTKAALAKLSSAACTRLLESSLCRATAAEVAQLLDDFAATLPVPLISPDLVVAGAGARTKQEAIKQAVDELYVAGRTDRPREIEQAVWRREAVYSTGFGFGFAVPHCKTDAVRANSLVVLKLAQPVEWGSLDAQPVRVLVLLVIRESDRASAHMKILAALARRMMHEEFRERILAEDRPEQMCELLEQSLAG